MSSVAVIARSPIPSSPTPIPPSQPAPKAHAASQWRALACIQLHATPFGGRTELGDSSANAPAHPLNYYFFRSRLHLSLLFCRFLFLSPLACAPCARHWKTGSRVLLVVVGAWRCASQRQRERVCGCIAANGGGGGDDASAWGKPARHCSTATF